MDYTVQYRTLHSDSAPAPTIVNDAETGATPRNGPVIETPRPVDTSLPLDFHNEWLEVSITQPISHCLQIFIALNNWASLCVVSVYTIISLVILW